MLCTWGPFYWSRGTGTQAASRLLLSAVGPQLVVSGAVFSCLEVSLKSEAQLPPQREGGWWGHMESGASLLLVRLLPLCEASQCLSRTALISLPPSSRHSHRHRRPCGHVDGRALLSPGCQADGQQLDAHEDGCVEAQPSQV